MNLIILTECDALGGERFRVCDYRATHIRKVLGGSVNDVLEVGLLDGAVGKGHIEVIDDTQVVLRCQWEKTRQEPGTTVDLICALSRPQTLRKVLHSAAAMGIRQVHLIRTRRTEKSYFDASILKAENIRRFLLEGLSQGKQTRLPRVDIHKRFRPFFEDTLAELEQAEDGESQKLLLDVDGHKRLDEITLDSSRRIVIAIGPEGGWVPFEVELMISLGFKAFELGPWPLRVENALVAAMAQIELTVHRTQGR